MKSGLRSQLAEKMAGEITLSDSPGHALKKWRMNFEILPGVLSERLGVSPSVIKIGRASCRERVCLYV